MSESLCPPLYVCVYCVCICMCMHAHTHTLISLSHEILHWGHHSFMFYSESQYPDLTLILITHRCDVVSAKGTLKNEGFIVWHMGWMYNPSWRGNHGSRSVRCWWLGSLQMEKSGPQLSLGSSLFISSTVAAMGRVALIQGGSPLFIYTSVEIIPPPMCVLIGALFFFQVCDEKPINIFTYMFLTSCLPFMSKFLKSTSQVLL